MLDDLAFLLVAQENVITRRQALRHLSRGAIEHRLTSGRWQAVHRGVYVTHTGPVTHRQRRWIASLAAVPGRRALLAGLSALELHGFRGYPPPAVHILLPARFQETDPPSWVVVHRTRTLPARDVLANGAPPCTMPARSLVDAASWAATDERARAIVTAGFQQRLVGAEDVAAVLARLPRVRRRALIAATATDAACGAHSITELEFLRLCRTGALPEPVMQVLRRDRGGRRRYLDAEFRPWGVQVEVDGSAHIEVRAWWDDMKRQNDLWIAGSRVLRFPAWVIRSRPDEVIAQVRAALVAAGWTPQRDRGGPYRPELVGATTIAKSDGTLRSAPRRQRNSLDP